MSRSESSDLFIQLDVTEKEIGVAAQSCKNLGLGLFSLDN
jgi:hypothetical protein